MGPRRIFYEPASSWQRRSEVWRRTDDKIANMTHMPSVSRCSMEFPNVSSSSCFVLGRRVLL